jgi:sarcosine oxidase
LAHSGGATLLERRRVLAIEDRGDELTIATDDGGSMSAGRVIVATDAWTSDLLASSFGLELPLTVTQEQVAWFDAAGEAFDPARFPVWIWMDDPSFYGFPTHAAPGPKIGQDVGGREVTPATRSYDPDDEALARLDAFRNAHLPGLGGRLRAKTCLYTLTPDRDFIIDRLPDHPAVVVVLGAAHAYKFASILGRIAVELAIDGSTPSASDIVSFTIDRAALRDRNTVARYLV